MDECARQFLCTKCHVLVYICPKCDRGNIYCGSACSQSARKKYLKAANQRYWRSAKGKSAAAVRQRKFRATHRKTKKVTDQGSSSDVKDDVLSSCAEVTLHRSNLAKNKEYIQCYFCGCVCSRFVRLDFLNRNEDYAAKKSLSWPQGP